MVLVLLVLVGMVKTKSGTREEDTILLLGVSLSLILSASSVEVDF